MLKCWEFSRIPKAVLDLPMGGATSGSYSGRDRIQPESLSKKNREGEPHADRTELVRPRDGNPWGPLLRAVGLFMWQDLLGLE